MGRRMPWVKYWVDDFRDDAMKLQPAQRWYFWDLITLIDRRGAKGVLITDTKSIADWWKVRTDNVERMLGKLIEAGLIQVQRGRLLHKKSPGFGQGELELDPLSGASAERSAEAPLRSDIEENQPDNAPHRGKKKDTDTYYVGGEPRKGEAIDPWKHVFDTGKAMLAEYGFSASKSGAIIQRLRKDRTPEEMMRAIMAAGTKRRSDIIAHFQGCLRAGNSPAGKEAAAEMNTLRKIATGELNGEPTHHAAGDQGAAGVHREQLSGTSGSSGHQSDQGGPARRGDLSGVFDPARFDPGDL